MRAGGPPTFLLARWVFLRLLGVTYLIAFLSLSTQVVGLVGDSGILPAGDYLDRVRDVYEWHAYRYFPTLLWISASDLTLTLLCWAGVGLSLLLVLGIAPVATLWTLWGTYLSLVVGGQIFLGFQWDALLLETGLLACFFAPRGVWPTLATEAPPSPWARWLIWWLLFRLMFLSGITKLASGDATWANWTALTYHYETQPLPLWSGWYLHHLPAWLHQTSVAIMFAIELLLPWLILTPARLRGPRQLACAGLVLLQLVIGLTGNYGFFSILSIVLCLTLLDDTTWARLLPFTLVEHTRIYERDRRPRAGWRQVGAAAGAVLLLALGGLTFAREVNNTVAGSGRAGLDLGWSDRVIDWVQPFRSVNGYGLFRVMTTERPEIILEASRDGSTWVEWPLRWKPGPLDRAPGLVAPHQPRLDWQLWFAALDPQGDRYWLVSWMRRLLAGDPDVTALMGDPPIADGPPGFLRLAFYDYRFTTTQERAERGHWWHRDFVTYLTTPVSTTTP